MTVRGIQIQSTSRRILRGLRLALAIAALCAGTNVAQQELEKQPEAENKRILILFNNDSFTATQLSIDWALCSTLKNGSSVSIETYSEYEGNTRAGTGYEKQFVELLRQKYEGKRF